MINNELGIAVVEQSIYNRPAIQELKTDKIVTFELGNFKGSEYHKNSFFKHLFECYDTSNTNRACIDSISDQTYGKGLAIEGKDGEPVKDGAGNSRIEKLKKIIKAKDLKKFIKDYTLYGQAAFQITYKGVGNRKKIEMITWFPIETLAYEKMTGGELKAVLYHHDWENYEKRDKLKRIPLFGKGGPEATTEIAILKPYTPGYYYFVPPCYNGGLDYCVLENRISEFLINDIDNGFSGTTIINVNKRIKDTDKRDYFVGQINEVLSGARGHKNLITFNDDEKESLKLERFPLSDAASHYDYLAQECSRKILTSHRITNPKILAVPTPGEMGLGNNANEIQIAAEMLQNLVIQPKQDEVTDFLSEILEQNNFTDKLMLVDLEIISNEKFEEGYYETNAAFLQQNDQDMQQQEKMEEKDEVNAKTTK